MKTSLIFGALAATFLLARISNSTQQVISSSHTQTSTLTKQILKNKHSNLKRLPMAIKTKAQNPVQKTKTVLKHETKSNQVATSKAAQISREKAKMIKKNHLKRIMNLKKQSLKHRRDTKQLMRKSEMLGKKMMLAVQNIERFPAAGAFFADVIGWFDPVEFGFFLYFQGIDGLV